MSKERTICLVINGTTESLNFGVTEQAPNNRRPGSQFNKGDKFRYFDYETTFQRYKNYREHLKELWEKEYDGVLRCSPNQGVPFEEIVLGYSVTQNTEDSFTVRIFMPSDEDFS